MKTTRLIVAGLSAAALLVGASTAFAQSQVTGTLSSGGTSTTTTSTSLSGTVSGGAGSGTNATGGGGGSGSNVVDICPNLSGTQSTLPPGYVVSGGNCVQSTSGSGSVLGTSTGTANTPSSSASASVLGTSTANPTVPNTGAGGNAAATMAVLALSSIAALGGMRLLKPRKA